MEPVVKRKKQQSVATDVGKTRFCSRANNNTKRAPVSNKNRLVPISRTADSIWLFYPRKRYLHSRRGIDDLEKKTRTHSERDMYIYIYI